MSELAKRIEVIADGGLIQGRTRKWSLRVDGQEFPWHVTDVTLTPNPDEWPAVTLRIPANVVTSTHSVEGAA